MEALKQILKPKTFNVLIVDFSKDHAVSAFVVQRKKNWEVSSEINYKNIEDFCKNTKSNNPVLLHCKGKGVISRNTESHPNLRDNLTVNGDKLDFYFNELHQDQAYVSMVRKDKIEPVIKVLNTFHHIIYNFSIGPFILQVLSEKGKIENDYLLEINESKIKSFSQNKDGIKSFNFNDKLLNGDQQYALASVLVLSEDEGWTFPFTKEEISINRKESAEKRKFALFGVFILSFFLLLLFSNYLYQGYLNQENADLEGEISVYAGNLSQIEQLNSEIERKTALVSSSAVSSANYLSYYIDQIVSSVPNAIKLSNLEVYPLTDKLKQKRRISLDESIEVVGVVANSRVMDNWVLELEKLSWTRKIQIINFSRAEDSKSAFEIKIFIKDELVQ